MVVGHIYGRDAHVQGGTDDWGAKVLPLYTAAPSGDHATRKMGLPRWVGTRKIKHSGFCWSRHDGVAVASAEPYASYLQFAPDDNHATTSSVKFLRAGCPSWHPTNSVKAFHVFSISKYLREGRFGGGACFHIQEQFLRLWVVCTTKRGAGCCRCAYQPQWKLWLSS